MKKKTKAPKRKRAKSKPAKKTGKRTTKSKAKAESSSAPKRSSGSKSRKAPSSTRAKSLNRPSSSTKPKSTSVPKGERQAIVQSAQAFIPGKGWGGAPRGGSKLPAKLKALTKAKKAVFEPSKVVKAKRILSAKTGKPLSKAGGGRKVVFEYTYEDGTTFKTKPFKPTKPVLAMFKAQGMSRPDEVSAFEPSKAAKKLIFERSIQIIAGGPIGTTRDAVAKLLGSWVIPPKGIFEILIYWKVFADKQGLKVLDAPPSKRFIVDAQAMRSGYGEFLGHLKELKLGDLEDAMGLSLDEIKAEYPDALKKYVKSLTNSADTPKNSTRAFIEKQILSMAKGRGVYISDKSKFADFQGQKKKKGKKKPEAVQAQRSDLSIMVWTATAKRPAHKGRKMKKKRRG